MDCSEFQQRCRETATYPERGRLIGLLFTGLGLAEEAGEVAGKLKRVVRDDGLALTEARRAQLRDEIGDVFWYLAQTATEAGLDLNDIAAANVEKNRDRAARGVVQGDGDNR